MKSYKIILASLILLHLPFYFNSQEKIIIKWGDVLKNHPSVKMAEKISEEVKNKSNGRIEIKIYPEGQLGGSKDMISATIFGTQQIVIESPSFFQSYMPSITVLDAPYIWRDIDHIYKVLDGPIGEKFNKDLIETKGIRILGVTYYGIRHITTSNKQIVSVKDMKGLKLRVQQYEMAASIVKAWNAVPVQINFNETYFALKEGLVDGQENPLPTIDIANFASVQKYLILTGHVINPRLIFINEKFWQKFSSTDQMIIQEAINNGIKWHNAEVLRLENESLNNLKSKGMIVIIPKIDEFRKAAISYVIKEYEKFWGKGMYEKISSYK